MRPTPTRPLATPLLPALLFALAAALPAPAATPPFTDEAATTGLDFRHFNGMSGELYLLENMGAGAALLDYDNDGDLDAYLVQGGMLGPGKTLDDALFPPPPGPLVDRLYRNDLTVGPDGTPIPRFVDVTERAGLNAGGYGMGVATGDVDNDGCVDLYLTNFGGNQLWRNRCDGTFREATAEAGVEDPRWSVPASFFDLDGDGLLDLYVGNYVRFDFDLASPCPTQTGAPDYCGPLAYTPEGDRLFRNRGDGTFEDLSAAAGIEGERGGALGVVAADFDGDRRVDIYVANDMTPNRLWINREDGRLSDEALLAGCAVNWEGKPEASMGVDAGDFDGDGDEDLFLAHLTGETNTLYRNDGRGIFRDETQAAGLANPSWQATGFGTAWLDYDFDGLLDLLVANGAVKRIEELVRRGDPYPLHQRNQLFRNLGDGRFEEVTAQTAPVLDLSEVSRGAAFGDVDQDGDADVLITNNAGPARLLVNRVGQEASWTAVALETVPGRAAIGARVRLAPAGDGAPAWARVRTDGSYGSAGDPRVRFGLGGAGEPAELLVGWADGSTERWREMPARAYLVRRRSPGPPPP